MKTSTKILYGCFGFLMLASVILQVKTRQHATFEKRTQIIGSGIMQDTTISVSDFHTLDVEDHVEVFIKKGEPKVVMHVDNNLQDLYAAEVKDGILSISRNAKSVKIKSKHRITVYVTNLHSIVLNDFSKLFCDEEIISNSLSIKLTDHSSANMNIQSSKIGINMDDFSELNLVGSSHYANLIVDGHARLNLGGFNVQSVDLDLDDFAQGDLQVTDTIRGNVEGHAQLSYKGNPKVSDVSVDELAKVNGEGAIIEQ